MVEAGMTHVVLETTSHGLAQHRVTACEYDIAAYTNVTHEHLDYHGSYESYLATKGLLIEYLKTTHAKPQGNPRFTVLNADDLSFAGLKPLVEDKWISYSTQGKGELKASEITPRQDSIDFEVEWKGQKQSVHCPMPDYSMYRIVWQLWVPRWLVSVLILVWLRRRSPILAAYLAEWNASIWGSHSRQ
jgi:UDP-N-acetylmuramoyl-L-alanyl-D-glutamate--2,6-diaminopimelate ligase